MTVRGLWREGFTLIRTLRFIEWRGCGGRGFAGFKGFTGWRGGGEKRFALFIGIAETRTVAGQDSQDSKDSKDSQGGGAVTGNDSQDS